MMHPLSESWDAIIRRCTNPSDKRYRCYGGKGVKICAGWMANRGSFIEEIEAALGPRPAGKTIDRRNNEGSYSCGHCDECLQRGWPFNVRWATSLEQARNKSNNRVETVNGVTGCLIELCEHFGLPYSTIRNRLHRGWSVHRAYTTPKLRG